MRLSRRSEPWRQQCFRHLIQAPAFLALLTWLFVCTNSFDVVAQTFTARPSLPEWKNPRPCSANLGRGLAGRRARTSRQATGFGTALLEAAQVDEAASQLPENPLVAGSPRMEKLWEKAATAAAASLQVENTTATTVLLPSGASFVVVGLNTVRKIISERQQNLRILVLVPATHLAYAYRVYAEAALDNAQVVTTREGGRPMLVSGLRNLLRRKLDESMVILSSLEEAADIALAQTEKLWDTIDLMVMEMAHLARAGGYAELAKRHIQAPQKLYISARRLVGRAPGALLAPGQEPDYPSRASSTTYGDEAFRIVHSDAYQLGISVPVQIALLEGTKVAAVAQQLADMHRDLGVCTFKLVPHRASFAAKLQAKLQVLTDGACHIQATNDTSPSLDAVILADPSPDYVKISEELARLARPSPGKRRGYILAAAVAKEQAVAVWRALAIETEAVEEALQDAGVASGRLDRDLQAEEIPREMAACLQQLTVSNEGRKAAELCANRGMKALSDPWDRWYGLVLAYKDAHGSAANIGRMVEVFGHRLGFWLDNQRFLFSRRQLASDKVLKLRRAGIMMKVFEETFTRGLQELRRYVLQKRIREVPTAFRTDSGFALGEWVLRMRTLQRRGKLKPEQLKALQKAFFVWQPSARRQTVAKHPEDFDAALVTRAIEEELVEMRWRPRTERKQLFRSLVIKFHPDVSEEKYATEAIQFLSDIRDWFLVT